ncbi:MAG TPA: L-seryl-tRNA(Sec) selenium transferase [Candidatus Acidoferrales bacterium]
MNPVPESAARLQKDSNARLRAIPSVDELLLQPRLVALAEKSGHSLVTQTVRQVLADFRARLKSEPSHPAAPSPEAFDSAQLEARVVAEVVTEVIVKVETALAPSLRRVINATGVVLHTNLGRAPLSRAALAQINATAATYSNLEYDISRGERGKRDVHTGRLLAELVGAESAIVVNNNAAAVFLVLNALAKGAEVIVSRGELIEIGDGFRIPDIMAESGALLHEVGTTNRTRLRDYERAISDRTRMLLRVHPSNFRITGFTERPSLAELVALGERFHLPVYEDLGSGCIADLSANGIAEPVARASCDAGASVITFSGDKLLGGPQAGIIAGKKEFIERIRANPLFRALRVDKLTIAALEATLQSYLRGAFDEIPSLRMIQLSQKEIANRAQDFCEKLRRALSADVSLEVHPGFSVIGGGSTPDQQLPTTLIAISTPRHSAAQLEELLRNPRAGNPEAGTLSIATPVIARIEENHLILDLRTVDPSEETEVASALTAALA